MKRLILVGVLLVIVMFEITANSKESMPHIKATINKPQMFKIGQSRNDRVCTLLTNTINQDINRYGEFKYAQHKGFIKWRNVEEESLDRGESNYDGQVEHALADINNDGIADKLIRSKWLISEVSTDHINILPKNAVDIISIDKLIQSDKRIDFNSSIGNYSISNYIQKHGPSYDWFFDGVASINLFEQDRKTYVVAHNYSAPSNVSARVYIFYLDRNYAPPRCVHVGKNLPMQGMY